MKVADVMTAAIARCNTGDSLNRAAQLMWERRCGCVPVLDDDGRPVGLVTDRDVCMAAYTQGRRLDDIAVTTVMSRPARRCRAADAIEDAEDLMMAHGIRRLVVVDADGRACGIVSLDDIARGGAAWDAKGDIDLDRVAVTLAEVARHANGAEQKPPRDQTSATDLTDFVQNSLAALRTLRGEIRNDLDAAGNEVRARWQRLETRLRAAEAHAHEAREEAARNLTGLLETARRFRGRLRDKSKSAP